MQHTLLVSQGGVLFSAIPSDAKAKGLFHSRKDRPETLTFGFALLSSGSPFHLMAVSPLSPFTQARALALPFQIGAISLRPFPVHGEFVLCPPLRL